jgi:hypothetical protein
MSDAFNAKATELRRLVDQYCSMERNPSKPKFTVHGPLKKGDVWKHPGHLKPTEPIDDRSLVQAHVERVEVQREQLVIRLTQFQKSNREQPTGGGILHVPWHKTPSTRRREILLPRDVTLPNDRPIRSETRATLVASIAQGRRWLEQLVSDPAANVEGIAKRGECSVRKVNMTISLAFLATAWWRTQLQIPC